jgi:hypothetical protein
MRQHSFLHRAVCFAALSAAVPLAIGCGHESAASPGDARSATAEAPASLPEAAPAPDEAAAAGPGPAEPASPSTAADSTEPAAAAPQAENPANDAEPPRKVGQRPPADRTATRPGGAEKITFDDLNLGMPADVVFRPFMLSDRVKELEGKRVSILGFIHAGAADGSRKNIKEFILLKNTECKYGPQGQADHLAAVYMRKDQATDFQTTAIKVEGTLAIEPYTGDDGNTWRVFRLDDAIVK